MAERIRNSVLPSGVKFSVRNLIGADQDLLTEAQDGSDNSKFDEMLAGALRSLGSRGQNEISKNVAERMLSNDRKFALITIREHTLGYQKEFRFEYEWPLREGFKEKEVVPYSIKLTAQNFPIVPYFWVKEEIENQKSLDKDYLVPDGHTILFPELYSDYDDMLSARSLVNGIFPAGTPSEGTKFRWNLLNGEIEKKYAKEKMVINKTIEMRKLNYLFSALEGKEQWAMFDTKRADIMDLEFIRKEMKDKEGFVDTMLTIQHPDMVRSVRVDLVSLPVFFFPSQAL